ncbi:MULTISPECIES: ABC transporter substrate-binding protein [Bacillaceae]|uniref:ABC transporter substrate-binding protein n=1 Tax=Bacillaceae TaxID=186817 RepID=UPI000C7868E9|nr:MULTISPECIES: extracellular solute-binding protein [Bacillaceae]PLR67424.1 hypothetical protein CYJ36_12215 [Bacillus sp. UMB0893]QNG59712.1 extracellular solute-binding protein [Bacillus sp. PAMC26568]
MKRLISIFFVIMLSFAAVLAGCSSTSEKTSGQTEGKTEEKNGEAGKDEKVTITYASWTEPEIEEKRIAAFEKSHPNIEVKRDESITWPWDEKLAASAAAGKLPDVFFVFSVPPSIANGWVEDLTPFLEKDKEFNKENIFGNLTSTAEYNGKQFALPHSMYAQGIMINKDLFKKENVEIPSPDWTIQDMRDTALKLTKVNEQQFGFGGVGGLREVIIPQLDPSQGWLTWDGEKYNFDKPAFIQANQLVREMKYNDKVSPEIYTDEDRKKWFGKDGDAWKAGKLAMRVGGTADFSWQRSEIGFEWDLLPIPKDKGQRVPIVTDYIGMSKTSDQKEAAFEFIKWMTYSKDGWMDRIDAEAPISSLPLINDEEVWDKYLNSEHVPESVKNIVPMISDGFVDGWKWLPGYQEVMTNIVGPNYEKFDKGEVKPEDFANDFQTRSNQAYEDAMKKMEESSK